MLWILWTACGLLDLERGHDKHLETTWSQDGVSLRIPEGGNVRQQPGMISVDAADGSRWFDIAWVNETEPELISRKWAPTACDPMSIIWDQPSIPAPDLWAGGGLCTVKDHRYWAIVAIKKVETRSLRITYLADFHRMPFEDAYVDFVQTALTITGGPEPVRMPDQDLLRERVRQNAQNQTGIVPVPGGGLLLTNLHPAFADAFALQAEASAPSL